MRLYYQDAAQNPQYNGNIAQMDWTRNGSYTDSYRFRYDELNRLLTASYNSTQSGLPAGAYNTSAAYDENGNIMKFNQYYNRSGTRNALDIALYFRTEAINSTAYRTLPPIAV